MSAADPGQVPAEEGPVPFRLDQDLPAGVTLLEASAGTGKTHTIAGLATRYLAEGVPVEALAVVTFTRSATGELRSRVRSSLAGAEAGLRAVPSGATDGPPDGVPPADDELLAVLSRGSEADVRARQQALLAALSDFDAATITTIHGFCERMLGALGTAADYGRDVRFVEDQEDLVDEVVDDFYLRKFIDVGEPPLSRRQAHAILAAAVANRDALIEPSGAGARSDAGMRAALAARGRDEVVRRARAAGVAGWDDQLHRLRESLTGPTAATAVPRLRDRFDVVLVDEFQDTDPVQWDVFRTAFAGTGTPLLLIGDPKQAIYNFRGADVWAYLAARRAATAHFTLSTNWRSDQPLLDALDALLGGTTLGHPDIPYRRVTAAPGRDRSGLAGAPVPAPMRLRLVHRGDGVVDVTTKGWAQADSARQVVAADLAAQAAGLLSAGATIPRAGGGRGALVPGDLAVLVRANREATLIHAALDAAGIPSVIGGGGSVFASSAAAHWLALLEALEQPASTTRARAAALTPFVGWDVGRLAAAVDDDIDGLQATLHRWSVVLAAKGVASLGALVWEETGLTARELARQGGERRLTDLGHVSQLLHAEALAAGAGTRALTAWLRERISSADADAGSEERTRRLDSDAEAVQIHTIHRSKGLEFPVVFLPFMWNAWSGSDELPLYHDPDRGDRRTVDVGGPRPDGFQRHKDRAAQERWGEDLRQAYVALTRARHQVLVWWATGSETHHSPLARLVLGRDRAGSVATRPARMPDDDTVEERLVEVASRAPGRVAVERVGAPTGLRWEPAGQSPAELSVRVFERDLDTAWRRASYTALTAGAHTRALDPAVGSEVEEPGVTDEPPPGGSGASGAEPEPVGEQAAGPGGGGDGWPASPMAGLAAGASFGIAVHGVLEAVDFAAGDLDAELAAATAALPEAGLARAGVAPAGEGGARRALAEALRQVVETPLGPLAGGIRLRDVARSDRLDELAFELPLAGGDRAGGSPQAGGDRAGGPPPAGSGGSGAPAPAVAGIAECMRRWLPPGDPLEGYPERLGDPALAQELRGYLVGSLDLVFRHRAAGGERFVVVDYKTNWLASPGEALTAWHYRPGRLAEAMIDAHYPLQAVLYSVALHRFLRWRLAGYRPERHLGGVLYLFVRGMIGAGTPVVDGGPCGVFSWAPPAGMIAELSDLFDSAGGAGGFDSAGGAGGFDSAGGTGGFDRAGGAGGFDSAGGTGGDR